MKKGFVTWKDLKAHLEANWREVHELWQHIKAYIQQGGTHTHPGSDITSKVDDADKVDGREIYVSDDPPSGGNDGDIWFEY